VNNRIVNLNTEQSLELWKQGRTKWNLWAKDNDGASVSFKDVKFSDHSSGWSEETRFDRFIFPGNVDFHYAVFENDVYFDSSKFRGRGSFVETEFQANSYFANTVFIGNADFRRARFLREVIFFQTYFKAISDFDDSKITKASFHRSKFYNDASFNNAEFFKIIGFEEVRFLKSISFNWGIFHVPPSFNKAIFFKHASFLSIEAKNLFQLDDVIFRGPTTFKYSKFDHALDLSDSQFLYGIPDFTLTKTSHHISITNMILPVTLNKNDVETPEKLMRLRVFAADSKDFSLEHKLFKLELMSRRSIKKPVSDIFLNYSYRLLSDFRWSVSVDFKLVVA